MKKNTPITTEADTKETTIVSEVTVAPPAAVKRVRTSEEVRAFHKAVWRISTSLTDRTPYIYESELEDMPEITKAIYSNFHMHADIFTHNGSGYAVHIEGALVLRFYLSLAKRFCPEEADSMLKKMFIEGFSGGHHESIKTVASEMRKMALDPKMATEFPGWYERVGTILAEAEIEVHKRRSDEVAATIAKREKEVRDDVRIMYLGIERIAPIEKEISNLECEIRRHQRSIACLKAKITAARAEIEREVRGDV